ncbi:MAG: DUF4340 domain-containing protein [Alphaproteobacteria bacterium]|nr:DUF4340 domain-containing protein [Alphaproteobacteria bacterium]
MTTNQALGGLLAVQLALAAFTWWPRPDGPEPQKVFPYAPDTITRVSIESTSTRSRKQDLILEKKGETWGLASGHDFPVIETKVHELLEAMTSLTYRTPVATSPLRHEQLNVDDETPTRRIKVTAGGQESTVLLGAASGKRMNVRFEGHDEVYQVDGMGAWSFADNNGSWVERERLNLDRATLKSVRLKRLDADFELVQADDGVWSLADLADGEQMDRKRVDDLLDALVALTMSKPADPALVKSEPEITVSWRTKDGGEGRYDVVGSDEDALLIELPPSPPFEMASVLPREQMEQTQREDLLVEVAGEGSE